LRRLGPYADLFGGVRVGSLREEMGAWVRVLEVTDGVCGLAFPEIGLEDFGQG